MTILPMPPEDIAKLKTQIIARKEQKNWLQGDESPKCIMTANEILSLIAAVEDKVNQLGGAPEDLRNTLCGVIESFGIDGAQKVTEYALKHRGLNTFNGKLARGKVKVQDHLLVAIEKEIEHVKPIPVMGDDDSIHLTERQIGFKNGLQWTLCLLRNNNNVN